MFERQRWQMIEKFVRGAGIEDERIITAMSKVPRHLFVEPALAHQAYSGKTLPIGFGQTISHPTTVALMTSLLEIRQGDRILEIGTGSGYQAAVLTEMGADVFTIERIPELARRAQQIFERLGYYSIAVRIGDGSFGWPEKAPFQGIIVTAGAPSVPETLLNQLAEGGRMVIPIGDEHSQQLTLIQKENNSYLQNSVQTRKFVPFIGKKGWSGS